MTLFSPRPTRLRFACLSLVNMLYTLISLVRSVPESVDIGETSTSFYFSHLLSAQLDVKALNFFSATNTARLQREVNNGLAMAHFKSTRCTGLLLVNTVITRFSLVRKDQNCDRAEQQKLVDQMAILDTCKAKNLVYGSFHPLQNPPMFSVSYPPSLTGNHFCHLNLTSNFAKYHIMTTLVWT